jgi:tetratricopeptide (TPR) repeat protein
MLLRWAGEYDLSHEAAQECLDSFRVCGDKYGEIDGLLLVVISRYFDWNSENQALYQQALDLSKSLGDQWRQAWVLTYFPLQGDNLPRRISSMGEAVALFRKVGDIEAATVHMMELAYLEWLNGNPQTAQNLLKQAVQESQDGPKAGTTREMINLDDIMALSQKLRNKVWLSSVLQDYGIIAFSCGDSEEAYRGLQKSIEISQEYGDRMIYSWSRAFLGYLFLQQGNITGARDIFVDTTHNFQKDQIVIGVVFSLEGMASYYVVIGKHLYAARLIGWADATREKIDDRRPVLEQADVDKIIVACLAKLGEVAFSDAYDEGQKMSLEEAVAFALGQGE